MIVYARFSVRDIGQNTNCKPPKPSHAFSIGKLHKGTIVFAFCLIARFGKSSVARVFTPLKRNSETTEFTVGQLIWKLRKWLNCVVKEPLDDSIRELTSTILLWSLCEPYPFMYVAVSPFRTGLWFGWWVEPFRCRFCIWFWAIIWAAVMVSRSSSSSRSCSMHVRMKSSSKSSSSTCRSKLSMSPIHSNSLNGFFVVAFLSII